MGTTLELSEIQKKQRAFNVERQWHKFSPSHVFTHLIEELGEIGRYILFEVGYKKESLGHQRKERENLSREFAQAFNLFLQLAIHFDIDLESSWMAELARMEKRFNPTDWKKYMESK